MEVLCIIIVYSIAVLRGGFALKRKRKSKIEFERDNTKQNHVGRWDRIVAVYSLIIGEKKTRLSLRYDNHDSKFLLHIIRGCLE